MIPPNRNQQEGKYKGAGALNSRVEELKLKDGSVLYRCVDGDYHSDNYWSVNAHRSTHSPKRVSKEEPAPVDNPSVEEYEQAATTVVRWIQKVDDMIATVDQLTTENEELKRQLARYQRFVS